MWGIGNLAHNCRSLLWYNYFVEQLQHLTLTCQYSASLLPEVYSSSRASREALIHVCKEMCTRMFGIIQSVRSTKWKQPNCSTSEKYEL